jgi:hypothetical protein
MEQRCVGGKPRGEEQRKNEQEKNDQEKNDQEKNEQEKNEQEKNEQGFRSPAKSRLKLWCKFSILVGLLVPRYYFAQDPSPDQMSQSQLPYCVSYNLKLKAKENVRTYVILLQILHTTKSIS